MQIGPRPGHLDLAESQAAQATRDHHLVFTGNLGVGKEHEIAVQPMPVPLQEPQKAGTSHLFLALDEEREAQRQARIPFEEPADRRNVRHQRALVVGRAAPPEAALPLHRLERRRPPQLQRIRRLDVIVAVDDDVRPRGGPAALGENDRMQFGLDDLHRQTEGTQQTADKLLRPPHSVLVLRVRRNARQADVLLQFLDRIKHAPPCPRSRLGQSLFSSRPQRFVAPAGIWRRDAPVAFLLPSQGRRHHVSANPVSLQRPLKAAQCLKCRIPVKTMAMPRASAAWITSASLTDPPGWMAAVAPASAAAIRPSAKGNSASDATTDP